MSSHTGSVIKGGSFLIEDISFDRVFTPEDFTDEQKMIAKTTEEFVVQRGTATSGVFGKP